MSLKSQIMISLKEAMRAKDKISLETLRAVKSELLKMETAANAPIEISHGEEIKLLQKMQKQRKDAAAIYSEQGREELASLEIEQSAVLDKFLPQQLSKAALKSAILQIIEKVGATGPSDMGKVMGISSIELAGRAEGRTIADVVKAELNSK